LPGILHSLKRLSAFIIFIVIIAAITIGFFEFFIAQPINLPTFLDKLVDISLVFLFAAIAIIFLTRTKKLLTPHIGLQAATITQALLLAMAVGVTGFIVLGIFSVDPTNLLVSAGIITITVGLIISTFVGSILSGALVFTTYKFKIGEDVMVNNMPGKIVDMTALVMRIRTDLGLITVPNSAIASGGVIVTAVLPAEPKQETRLPYTLGDRIITSFRNEEGIVKELTLFHTTVLLDSGKEITFQNNTVLTGATAVAKIVQKQAPD
jgi:small-conductance mechanosensitive channel